MEETGAKKTHRGGSAAENYFQKLFRGRTVWWCGLEMREDDLYERHCCRSLLDELSVVSVFIEKRGGIQVPELTEDFRRHVMFRSRG